MTGFTASKSIDCKHKMAMRFGRQATRHAVLLALVAILSQWQAMVATALPIPSEGFIHPYLIKDSILPHPKGCQPWELWTSAQIWWLHTPESIALNKTRDFGHIHHEKCWPWFYPVKDDVWMDYEVMAHNASVYIREISTFESIPNVKVGVNLRRHECAETGGVEYGPTLDYSTGCNWRTPVGPFNSSRATETTLTPVQSNVVVYGEGDLVQWKEHFVPRQMQVISMMPTWLQVGDQPLNWGKGQAWNNDLNWVGARTWTSGITYGRSFIGPVLNMPVVGNYRVAWSHFYVTKAADAWSVVLDPNFHDNIPGTMLKSGFGNINTHHRRDSYHLDVSQIPSGWHTVMHKSDAVDQETLAMNSVVNIIMFETAQQMIPGKHFTYFAEDIFYGRPDEFGFACDKQRIHVGNTCCDGSRIRRAAYINMDLNFIAQHVNLTRVALHFYVSAIGPDGNPAVEMDVYDMGYVVDPSGPVPPMPSEDMIVGGGVVPQSHSRVVTQLDISHDWLNSQILAGRKSVTLMVAVANQTNHDLVTIAAGSYQWPFFVFRT